MPPSDSISHSAFAVDTPRKWVKTHPRSGRTGDYYHDAPAQKLYYISPAAPTRVVLPQSAALVTLRNATDVAFVNATFARARIYF